MMATVNELVAWILEQIYHDDDVGAMVGRASSGEWSEDRRQLVAQCQGWLAYAPASGMGVDGTHASFPAAAEVILRLLAVPYADRPGYLDEWRP
jgi:hypothetical protein